MNQPKVSILVPVYGVEQYIRRCAVSLFEQTYENIEYIFVDDATPDNSIQILTETVEHYPQRKDRVQILHHSQNNGISATRNTAINAATGEYILQVDSDDSIATDAIEKLVKVAEENRTDVVIFDTVELRKDDEVILSAEYKEKVSYIKGMLQHINRCAHWNKFYRTSFYKGTGIQCVEEIRLADDYAVTPRLIHQAQKIAVLHEALYYYETRNQSSYVHNLNRAAIESQHTADKVLVDYFRQVEDKDIWADVVCILPQRSVVSLVKHSSKETWLLVRDVYREELVLSGKGMKLLDKTIYNLFVKRHDGILAILIPFYQWALSIMK